VFTKKIVYVV